MLLTKQQLDNLFNSLNLTHSAKRIVEEIRSSEPSRRVGGGKRNVSGRFPSRKMGLTIQFESHKVELPFIYRLEHDDNVLEFYDQPLSFKMNCLSHGGRNISFIYTPDFFIICKDSIGWIECKTEEQLHKLSEKNSNRYFFGDDQQWHCPPGEQYAQQFGFFFRVWSDNEIDWTLQRNLSFLDDYYRDEQSSTEEAARSIIFSLVSAQPGISLAQLLHYAEGVTPDDIYILITNEQIYVDLTAAPLIEPEQCFIFRDSQIALAYRSTILSQSKTNQIAPPAITLLPGESICWDGKIMRIVFVGDTEVFLQSENGSSFQIKSSTIEDLIREGKITGLREQSRDGLSSEVMNLLLKADERDLLKANERYQLLQSYLQGNSSEISDISKRTLRDWCAKFRKAEQIYGYGFIGLLSFDSAKGNRKPKIPDYLSNMMEDFIEEKYETAKQIGKFHAYSLFMDYCISNSIPENQIPSYKTFVKKIKQRSGYNQTLKREGHRAAYSQEPFYLELELTTPRHGDRSFEIGHIDHTQLDIELRCSQTGKNLGRPWASFLIDAHDRRILVNYVTFDPPSYRSCMMVLRICVKRHGRLPQILVTDNGAEFHSVYFETVLAMFGCIHKYRPPAKARFSAVGERLFGTSATQLIHNLTGNTQITKKVRLITKSVNPKNLALWTLGALYVCLCEWAYEIYDTTEHPSLGQSPRDAFATSIAQHGSRAHRSIPYDENFRKLTLPTTSKGKAKVQPNYGVKIGCPYYWSNIFRDPEIEKTWVEVRYDPFDAGVAYAYVKGQWVECHSEHYAALRGRSEKEMQLASTELRKRYQKDSKNFKLRAKQLGAFLSSVAAQEILLEQRLRDAQVKNVFEIIEGKKLDSNSPIQSNVENTLSTINEESDQDNSMSAHMKLKNLNELGFYEEY